jgi:hypothetical protein
MTQWERVQPLQSVKTVITAVLMVTSGMDPHMISGNLGWVLGLVLGWVVSKWVGHGETLCCDRDRYLEEMSSLPWVLD